MALSDPRIVYGVHSVTPYNPITGEFYGTAKVLGGSSVSLSGELNSLFGGSNRFPWAIEDSTISTEITLRVKSYEDFLFQIFLGKAPTANGVDAAGSVSTPVEKTGTTIMSATTGLASVTVIPTTGAANLKFGKYVLKATSDDDLNIYAGSDIDFAHGTDVTFTNDLLLVGTVAIGDTGATSDVADLGLRFTAGSGTTAFTVGDTAMFEVLPPSTKSMEVVIGGSSDVFPEMGLIMYSKRRGNGEMFEIEVYRAKGIGMPIGLEENAFSEAEIAVQAYYDSTQNGIMKIRSVSPS